MNDIETIPGGVHEVLIKASNAGEISELAKYLLVGGGAALAGGLLTHKRKKNKGESRMSHLGRILRNAAVAGGLGAGGLALLNKGVDSFKDAGKTVSEDLDAAEAADAGDNPYARILKDIAYSPVTAGAAGGGALLATKGNVLKETVRGADSVVDNIIAGIKTDSEGKLQPSKAEKFIQQLSGKGEDINARINTELKLQGPTSPLSKLIRRTMHPEALEHAGIIDPAGLKAVERGKALSTIGKKLKNLRIEAIDPVLGRTSMQRLRRGGLFGAAALAPAIIGALTESSLGSNED